MSGRSIEVETLCSPPFYPSNEQPHVGHPLTSMHTSMNAALVGESPPMTCTCTAEAHIALPGLDLNTPSLGNTALGVAHLQQALEVAIEIQTDQKTNFLPNL
jgi:hypothetical protein